MKRAEEVVQFATRIPKAVHRELRLYSVAAPIMQVVSDALAEKLTRDTGRKRRST